MDYLVTTEDESAGPLVFSTDEELAEVLQNYVEQYLQPGWTGPAITGIWATGDSGMRTELELAEITRIPEIEQIEVIYALRSKGSMLCEYFWFSVWVNR